MTKETNNVIKFPKFFDSPPTSPGDVQEKLTKYKESYSTELTEIIWENVLGEMARAGCQFDEDINLYFPSMILIFESIKSLHLQTMGVEHALQEFAVENTLILEADGEHAMGGFKTKNEKVVDIDTEID